MLWHISKSFISHPPNESLKIFLCKYSLWETGGVSESKTHKNVGGFMFALTDKTLQKKGWQDHTHTRAFMCI